MYDKFKPFQIIEEGLNFSFFPSRYEVWEKGKLTNGALITGKLQCIPVLLNNGKSEVKTFSFPVKMNLRSHLIFDLTYTSGDRIYLATVPQKTNIDNYDSFQAFKKNVPLGFPIITQAELSFEEDTPYACSVFLIKQQIAKVSFSFGNNPRLLELYDDNIGQ